VSGRGREAGPGARDRVKSPNFCWPVVNFCRLSLADENYLIFVGVSLSRWKLLWPTKSSIFLVVARDVFLSPPPKK
jgi:hypothetical protein